MKKKFNFFEQEVWLKLEIEKQGNILNRSSLLNILKHINDTFKGPKITLTKLEYFLKYKLCWVFELQIFYRERQVRRLIPNYIEISPLEIALSLAGKNSFLSHRSALFVNGLTTSFRNQIFVNYEQAPKKRDKENARLTQKKVDFAFCKPVRSTKNKAIFKYKDITYKVIFLNGKNTKNLGVINIKPPHFSKTIKISNAERALIEATVRPTYAGGVHATMDAFSMGKNMGISINRLLVQLGKYDYIYPYEQAIYFFARSTNYSAKKLELIRMHMKPTINFYLDHQIANPILDKESCVYVPKAMVTNNKEK